MKRSVTCPLLVVAGAAVAPAAPLPADGAEEQASVFSRPPPRTRPPASFRNDFRVRPRAATFAELLAQTGSLLAESIKQQTSLAPASRLLPVPRALLARPSHQRLTLREHSALPDAVGSARRRACGAGVTLLARLVPPHGISTRRVASTLPSHSPRSRSGAQLALQQGGWRRGDVRHRLLLHQPDALGAGCRARGRAGDLPGCSDRGVVCLLAGRAVPRGRNPRHARLDQR